MKKSVEQTHQCQASKVFPAVVGQVIVAVVAWFTVTTVVA